MAAKKKGTSRGKKKPGKAKRKVRKPAKSAKKRRFSVADDGNSPGTPPH